MNNVWCNICILNRSPSKIKKIKPFKFPTKKEKHEKLKDKDFKEIQKEKKKDEEKDKKKDKTKIKIKDKKKQKRSDGKAAVDISILYGKYNNYTTFCKKLIINYNFYFLNKQKINLFLVFH